MATTLELFGIDISETRTDISVIDIENELEIWAEEMESDYECDVDEGYDSALLDLDVYTTDGKSMPNTEIRLILAYIISAWRDHTVLVHSGQDTWQLVHSLNNHRLAVNYARFHDKRKFITSSLDRTVVLYQLDESGDSILEYKHFVRLILLVHMLSIWNLHQNRHWLYLLPIDRF